MTSPKAAQIRALSQGWRIATIVAVLLSLASCSYVYRVRAGFVDGRLTFFSDHDQVTSPPWCLSHFILINDAGEPAWEFDGHEAYRNAETCGPNFPLTYGAAPVGTEVLVPPQRLQPGRLYVVEGSGGDLFRGAFVIHRSGNQLRLEDLDPQSPEAVQAQQDYYDGRASRHGT